MSTTLRHVVRPLLVLVSALALAVAGLGVGPARAADGDSVVLDVSTMEPGEYTSDTTVGDFTVHASEAKPVVVDAQSRTGDGGALDFTQRLKLGGAGNADYRSIEFTTVGEAYVTAYALSGSSGSDRALGLYTVDGSELATVPAYGDPGNDVPPGILPVPGAGTYYVASPSSGVNVLYLKVTEGPPPARASWSDVSAPTITAVSVDGGDVVVDYDGVVGWDGADVATATLFDDSGAEVTSAVSGTPSDSGTISLTPTASGDYEVQVALSRDGESADKVSAREAVTGFVLPLAAPTVNSSLTTSVSQGQATVTVGWAAVPEAESYDVAYRATGDSDWTPGPSTTGLQADVPGLTPGQDYEVQVTARRGDDSAASDPYQITPADAVERWQDAHAGVSSGGEITESGDGSLSFDVLDNNGKLADSEDGFLYHYTEIDPDTENFTLSATFTVDDADDKDNQSGFGIIAVDTFVPNDRSARYFNSAGAMTAKYVREVDGSLDVRYGTPGGKYVTGYTQAPTVSSSDRDMSRSQPFDWDYRSDWATDGKNPPRFQTGDVYDYALRKSNTGFHAKWRKHGDADWQEIIDYAPDMLLQQTSDSYYVGLFAARKIKVTASDIQFDTIDPADDDAPLPRPTTYIDPTVGSDVTRTTPRNELDVPVVSNVRGKIAIRDSDGANLGKVRVAADERAEIPVSLHDGTNELTLELKPANRNKQSQLGTYEDLSSYDTVTKRLTIEVARYGEPGQAIHVSPKGDPDGDGTPDQPLDIHTAVGFAQPGQQVVLEPGTYTPTRAIEIDRGNEGTAEHPIMLMSAPGGRAVLDLSESSSGGIKLRGDHWHLYDLEVTRSQGNAKPLIISGNHNVVERIETDHNGDTGLQISLPPNANHEPREMWPTDNLVVSTVSHDNADPLMNDADGFAAKLTVGKDNVFRYCISYNNIDDGWDLYAKSTTGSTGPVRIEDSVVYHNGWLQSDPETFGEGNGFKLGGESMPGAHVLSNSVSFENHAKGITSNSGPDVRIHDVTSYANGDSNLYLATSADSTDYEATGVLSYRGATPDKVELRGQDDDITGDRSNHLDGRDVTDDWFESLDTTAEGDLAPEIAADGSIDMHGLLELTDQAPGDTGARLGPNPSPSTVRLLPPVSGD